MVYKSPHMYSVPSGDEFDCILIPCFNVWMVMSPVMTSRLLSQVYTWPAKSQFICLINSIFKSKSAQNNFMTVFGDEDLMLDLDGG